MGILRRIQRLRVRKIRVARQHIFLASGQGTTPTVKSLQSLVRSGGSPSVPRTWITKLAAKGWSGGERGGLAVKPTRSAGMRRAALQTLGISLPIQAADGQPVLPRGER